MTQYTAECCYCGFKETVDLKTDCKEFENLLPIDGIRINGEFIIGDMFIGPYGRTFACKLCMDNIENVIKDKIKEVYREKIEYVELEKTLDEIIKTNGEEK